MGLIPETLSRSVERYGLGYIRPRHNEIARRLVCGQSQSDIARTMGINIGRLSIIVNSPLFKIMIAKLSKLRDDSVTDIQEELRELAPVAVAEIAKVVMTSTSETLRFKASQDILDRAGVIKKGQGVNIGIQVNCDPVNIEEYRNNRTIDVSVSSVQSLNDTYETVKLDEDDAASLRLLEEAISMQPEQTNHVEQVEQVEVTSD